MGYLDRFVHRVCMVVPEYRGAKLRYPCGALILGLLLAECAGRFSQRSKESWLKKHWHWIKKIWVKGGGSAVIENGTPSQSTISRLLATFSEETFARLVYEDERRQIWDEWSNYLKKSKARVIGRRKKKAKKCKHPKPMPQYCFDGKARKGCKSQETGRDEIDVTMYCPETNQVLDKQTLNDKEGERLAVVDMISKIGREVPPGIISGDAGIVSPMVTQVIVEAGHGYVLQIKGNAGLAYEETGDLPWDKVIVAHEDHSKGHGREELRVTKALQAEFAEFNEVEKYANIGVILQIERTSHYTVTGKVTHETAYYIGDEIFAALTLDVQARYVRDHWAQESYHWVKDAVMREDASMQRKSNGSRALSTFRSLVAKIGRAVCNSPKGFIDQFTADPQLSLIHI